MCGLLNRQARNNEFKDLNKGTDDKKNIILIHIHVLSKTTDKWMINRHSKEQKNICEEVIFRGMLRPGPSSSLHYQTTTSDISPCQREGEILGKA